MHAGDALAAERRRLPMVKIDKEYVFDGPDGNATLLGLFEGRRQLILYHFMFDPRWDAGCVGCSMLVDGIGHLAQLHVRDVSLVLVSRAADQAQAFPPAYGVDDSLVLILWQRFQHRL
jgi:predicted dithiol-disulfide oxidoreductase (DUF899 family)